MLANVRNELEELLRLEAVCVLERFKFFEQGLGLDVRICGRLWLLCAIELAEDRVDAAKVLADGFVDVLFEYL